MGQMPQSHSETGRVILAMVLLLAGCRGGDDAVPTAAAPTSQPGSVTTAEPTTIQSTTTTTTAPTTRPGSVTWSQDPLGVFMGGSHLFITPREMAKFGLLYLHQGQWQGEQVVPRDWVEESLTRHVGAYSSDDYDYGYGYWWLLPTLITDDSELHPYTVIAAVGYGTQRIYLIPELDIVVVFTADGSHVDSNPDEYLDTDDFIWESIIPAIIPEE